MDSEKINDIIVDFIEKDYKFGYSFNYNDDYEKIMNYWNYWFLNEQNINSKIFQHLKCEINDDIKSELDTIFRAHYYSSDDHLVLFYKSHSKEIFIKLKTYKVDNFGGPYWTIKISSEKLKKHMKDLNIKQNELSVLVYN